MEQPFPEDLRGALNWLTGLGLPPSYIYGGCFGGRAALRVASDYPSLRGIVIASLSYRDTTLGGSVPDKLVDELGIGGYLRRAIKPANLRLLADPSKRRLFRRIAAAKLRSMVKRNGRQHERQPRWLAANIEQDLAGTLESGARLHLVFGSHDSNYRDSLAARDGDLGPLSDRYAGSITLDVFEGPLHGYALPEAQEFMVRSAKDWIVGMHREAG
jgi:hypothetical protein